MPTRAKAPAVPRLTYLRIKNYRALRDVEFRDLTPLSVFIGPNGSGKSTVLDALAFLAEAVSGNLGKAWDGRGRFRGMRTQGTDDSVISLEIEVNNLGDFGALRYKIEITSGPDDKLIVKELLTLNKSSILFKANPSSNLDATEIESPWDEASHQPETSSKSEKKALEGTSSSVIKFAFVVSRRLSKFIRPLVDLLAAYSFFHLTDDHRKDFSDEGPRERLSPNGDNLPNVLYYLHLKHPETLAKITAQMQRWVPGLADIVTEITSDERLRLRFKDSPFEKPLRAKYVSGGTMRLAALLTLLYEPGAAGLLGIEEPENELHPQLLPRLAEELGKASETRQLLVATHSPVLLDGLAPEQVWVLHRGADGYTQATRTADIPNVKELVEDGSPLGYLWSSNFFTVGNPLAPRPAPSDAH